MFALRKDEIQASKKPPWLGDFTFDESLGQLMVSRVLWRLDGEGIDEGRRSLSILIPYLSKGAILCSSK
ncbi:hypothetical protein HPP92_013549 [Vanilla planifolia]|uniref:Uncharacterized protein n=1 Tax=Vanilla planifolia TaxID=51239 RepID=A0A835QZ96_VANPL|nr:hypothetical protein HPP92_013549 [Vanilla planifolia]